MAQQELSFEEAESLVKNSDNVRVAFVEEFYKVPWESLHAFDMVINTGKISPDQAVNWIVAAEQAPVTSLEIEKPTSTTIEVDRILEEAVSEELNCAQPHR